jgi:hypothetical protein
VPSPTIDWHITDALAEIKIEQRTADEVRSVVGRAADGSVQRVALAGASTAVANPAFDVTPARLVTGIITERGIAAPAELARLFADVHAEPRTGACAELHADPCADTQTHPHADAHADAHADPNTHPHAAAPAPAGTHARATGAARAS